MKKPLLVSAVVVATTLAAYQVEAAAIKTNHFVDLLDVNKVSLAKLSDDNTIASNQEDTVIDDGEGIEVVASYCGLICDCK